MTTLLLFILGAAGAKVNSPATGLREGALARIGSSAGNGRGFVGRDQRSRLYGDWRLGSPLPASSSSAARRHLVAVRPQR